MTNDLFGIWYPVAGLEQLHNQYNTIKSIQYYTRPRLIIISRAIGDKRILKFISSGWDQFKSLGVAQAVCQSLRSLVLPAADSASKTLRTTHCAWAFELLLSQWWARIEK